MIRVLFLCLLLLPATNAVSEENEGSANGVLDDEDLIEEDTGIADVLAKQAPDSLPDISEDETSDQFIMIVIIVAVTALTLSFAAIVTIMLVRRHMHRRQQGIYSVPTEQNHKGASL